MLGGMAILHRCHMLRLVSILEGWAKRGFTISVNILPIIRWGKKKLKERKWK